MSDLVVRGVETEAELLEAHQLVARTQQFEEEKALAWLATSGRAWPGFEFSAVRIALLENQIVGALRVVDVPLRIGRACLHAGGIGWVSTDARRRGQGICAALMADVRDYMSSKRFELSLLYGIPNLYERFGYVSAIPERSVSIRTVDIPHELVATFAHRSFHEEDIASILQIYENAEQSGSCSVARHEEWIRAQALSTDPKTPYWPDWPGTFVFVDEHDTIAGWMTPQTVGSELHVKELGVRDEGICESLLVAAKVLAHRAHADRICFHVPPSHLFARYLEQFDSIHETHFFRNREGMLALLDLDRSVHAMVPEWNERVASLQPAVDSTVRLRIGSEQISVSSRNGKLSIVHDFEIDGLPLLSTQFVQLMVGSRRPDDVIGSRWQLLQEAQQQLLKGMFPKREPFVWPIDHF